MGQGDYPSALRYLGEVVDNAAEIDDEEAVASARAFLGNFRLWLSDFSGAVELLEQATPVLERFQRVLEPFALASIGYAYGWTGEFARSFAAFERGLRIAQVRGHPSMEASNHYWGACIRYFQGRWSDAVAGFDRAEVLCREQNDALLRNWNAIIKGYALYMGGRRHEGIEMTREACYPNSRGW